MERSIGYYFDENMPVEAATQLNSQGISVMTTREASREGTSDLDQLEFATRLGRVICSQDKDFLIIARTHPVHCGIAFIRFKSSEIGALVKALRELHSTETNETMKNILRYL